MVKKSSPFPTLAGILCLGVMGLQVLFIYAIFLSYWREVDKSESEVEHLYLLTHNSYDKFAKSNVNVVHTAIDVASMPYYRFNDHILTQVFGHLPPYDHWDLRYRSREEVTSYLRKIFSELPPDGKFSSEYKNPCWHCSNRLCCVPYAYILGQPKCGTTELFFRVIAHPSIADPLRKEIRWFTRGEFKYEPSERSRIGPETSIYSLTAAFKKAAQDIQQEHDLITIDGGPHTLWWSTQMSDGSVHPEDIPPAQILREMQPNAKFIITLTDPVKRMYSDYNFIDDSLVPLKGAPSGKNAQEFHERAVQQVEGMLNCLKGYSKDTDMGQWFRAAQACAHDRHQFAVGGWGRISIGM